jgi:hypothetical protein
MVLDMSPTEAPITPIGVAARRRFWKLVQVQGYYSRPCVFSHVIVHHDICVDRYM